MTVLAVFFLFALVWGYQFIQLMVLSDADFPGRHDKILWVVAFLIAVPIAPFAFLYWKHAMLEVRRQERGEATERPSWTVFW